MSDDTQAASERLRTALAATSPGEWYVTLHGDFNWLYDVMRVGNDTPIAEMVRVDNAAFIATAHNDLPALLAEVERLQAIERRLLDLWQGSYEAMVYWESRDLMLSLLSKGETELYERHLGYKPTPVITATD